MVDLSWNDLVGGSLKALTFHLQHVEKLRVLRLCGCRLTAQDLTALGKANVYIEYSIGPGVIANSGVIRLNVSNQCPNKFFSIL